MLPKINKQTLLNEIRSLHSLESSLVKSDKLSDSSPHVRDAWDTFIDQGRARREILMFAIHEAKLRVDEVSNEPAPNYFPKERFLSGDKGTTIALFHTAYHELLKECEALGEQRLARKVNLAQSLIPKSAPSEVTKMTPENECHSPISRKPAKEPLTRPSKGAAA